MNNLMSFKTRFFRILGYPVIAIFITFFFFFSDSKLFGSSVANASEVRVAALQFGTVNWVLDVIKLRKLDEKYSFKMKVIPLASTNGAKIALQGGSAEIVTTDWTWVSRRRAEKADFTLVPYSSAVGHLMVAANSDIKTLEDLRGKKIAVAGGPLDKSWLFLRAYTKKKLGVDLTDIATPVFGAPPLLTQKMIRGEFDAILNFWHFSARLKAKGFRSLLSVGDVMLELGTSGPTVAIGFAFSEGWAKKNEKQLRGFLSAAKDAVAILDKEDAIWNDIRPRMKAKDEKTFLALRHSFRDGILRRPLIVEQADVQRLYAVLAKLGGTKLLGRSKKLSSGTFWLLGDISQPVHLNTKEVERVN
ncbi:ABC transporter substrate-binding protein [Hyphomicrobiales bacterium 4NK60-0047b]|jgi:NitT/TauT family transport system substrate-binding protein